VLPWDEVKLLVKEIASDKIKGYSNMRAKITFGKYEIHPMDRISNILKIVPLIDPERDMLRKKITGRNYKLKDDIGALMRETSDILKLFPGNKSKKTLYFVSLETDFKGTYWFRGRKNFFNAVENSLAPSTFSRKI